MAHGGKEPVRRSPIFPANGSTVFMAVVRREVSCSIWIVRASARPMASRRCSVLQRSFRLHLQSSRSSCSISLVISNGAALRPGNVHSADGWRRTCSTRSWNAIGARSQEAIYFRADAAFANPEVYEYPGSRGGLQICDPASGQPRCLQDRIGYLFKRPVGRPPNQVRRYYANFRYQATEAGTKPRRVDRQGRVASGRTVSPRRLHRHQPVTPGREHRRLLQSARHL